MPQFDFQNCYPLVCNTKVTTSVKILSLKELDRGFLLTDLAAARLATMLPSTAAELGWLFLDAITPPRGRALWAPGFQPGTQRAQPLKGESGCGRGSPSRDYLSPSGLRLLRSVCGMTAFRFGAWCGTPRSLGVPHPTPPPQPCHTLRSAIFALLALLRCAD